MLSAVVFDAYGTLLDVHGAMAAHAAALGPDWRAVSQDWRAKQLEYTWISALTGRHRDFWEITRAALGWAAAKHGVGDAALLESVAQAYRVLPAFPEVAAMLDGLRARGVGCAILSNGEPGMLGEAVAAAGLAGRLDAVLSVESVGVFKPAAAVYGLATAQYGVAAERIGFVSSNAWDAYGAGVFGMRVFWCNRGGAPVEYGLERSATVLADLAGLPGLL